jgi:hypothetical protein
VRGAIAQSAALLLAAAAADDRMAALARARHVCDAALATVDELLDGVARAAVAAWAVRTRLGARLGGVIAAIGSSGARGHGAAGAEAASPELFAVLAELARLLLARAPRHASVTLLAPCRLPQEALSEVEGGVRMRDRRIMRREAVPAEGGAAAANLAGALHVLAPRPLLKAARDGALAARAPLEHAAVEEGLEPLGAAHLFLKAQPAVLVARDAPGVVRLRAPAV